MSPQIIYVACPSTGLLARFPGTSGDYASTPDDPAFSALGDFSIVALVASDDWTPGGVREIASHGATSGNQRSLRFFLNTSGGISVNLSTNGTAASTYNSTSATGFTDGTMNWVLVTRESASGDIKFYTAAYTPGVYTPPAIGSFSQLGSTVSGLTGTLHNSTAPLEVGAFSSVSSWFDGDILRVSLYSGIYGSSPTLLRDFYPSDAANTSATSWASSSTGETWTLNGGDVTLHIAT